MNNDRVERLDRQFKCLNDLSRDPLVPLSRFEGSSILEAVKTLTEIVLELKTNSGISDRISLNTTNSINDVKERMNELVGQVNKVTTAHDITAETLSELNEHMISIEDTTIRSAKCIAELREKMRDMERNAPNYDCMANNIRTDVEGKLSTAMEDISDIKNQISSLKEEHENLEYSIEKSIDMVRDHIDTHSNQEEH